MKQSRDMVVKYSNTGKICTPKIQLQKMESACANCDVFELQ